MVYSPEEESRDNSTHVSMETQNTVVVLISSVKVCCFHVIHTSTMSAFSLIVDTSESRENVGQFCTNLNNKF